MIAYTLFENDNNSSIAVSQNQTNTERIFSLDGGFYASIFAFLTRIKWRFKPKQSFKRLFFLGDEFNDTYKKLKRTKQYQQADIIHLHNIHGGFFDLNALMKIGKEKKIVWTLHDMWAMTGGEAYTFENENYKIGIGKTPYLNVPPLNQPIIDRRQHFLELKKKIYAAISANITFVPVSKWLEDCFRSSYVFNNQLKVQTIYNGYDDSVFYTKNRKVSETYKILIFNSPSPFKGSENFKTIIDSIQVPFELFIVGEKPDVQNEKIIKTKVFSHVFDRAQLAELYNNIDILIFPSKAEAFGLIPLEAMACGVCVFASNINGIPEIIEHEKTGFLFDTINELCDQLNKTFQNKELVRKIGENAAKDVKNKFPISNMLRAYQDLYKNIAGK